MPVGYNFLCGRSPGADPSPVGRRPPEPDSLPPPCGRHKWMAPNQWRNEGAGEGGRPQAQPKEGAQKTEIWG